MENITNILENFCKSFKKEVFDFYNKCYTYFQDFYSHRNIDVSNLQSNDEKSIEDTILKLVSATNSALNTIGIAIEDLDPNDHLLTEFFEKYYEGLKNFDDLFEKSFKIYINKYLFRILFEYLLNLDSKKMENLDLFDLLPHKFIKKLKKFKNNNKVDVDGQKFYNKLIKNIDNYVDTSNLMVNIENLNSLEIQENLSDLDILKQLKEAREDNIEVLRISPKEEQKSLIEEKVQSNALDIVIPQQKKEIHKVEKNKYNYFSNLSKINSEGVKILKINTNNLLTSAIDHPELFDLENLFYFLSILKMLGIKSPIPNSAILEILKNYISGRVFSSGKFHQPNPISNFYGLWILNELDLINKSDIVDLLDIEMQIERELKFFIPEKFLLNFYTILCLKLLENSGAVITDKTYMIKPISNLDLRVLEQYSAPLDMFYQLSSLKLLDNDADISGYKNLYLYELKKLVTQNGLVKETITDSAKTLLIFDLLELKDQENEIVNSLFNKLLNRWEFFNSQQLDSELVWWHDKLGYKIELRMLFWTLLAYFQYYG